VHIGVVSDFLQRGYRESALVHEVILSGFFASNGAYQTPSDEQLQKVDEIIASLNIEHLRDKKFAHLSHGEQRKALIGRALVFEPKLLILDEPCTGLDIPSREDFLDTLRGLVKEGVNILFVTHHIDEIIPEVNKVLFIADGQIAKVGDKKNLMKKSYLKGILGYKELKIKKGKGRYWPKIH